MIQHPAFAVEPWALRETELSVDLLTQSGSVFALANGHIGLRANLDEGEPYGLPGSYLNGFYESRALPYAEPGYGYPEAGQVVVNVTNGTIMRLLVDDEPFDVRMGTLHRHERVLDFRSGLLSREAEWTSPAGQHVRVSSVRIVSFAHRAVAAIAYEVEPLAATVRLVVQSELVANEPMPDGYDLIRDPRAGTRLDSPLRSEEFAGRDAEVVLVHSTSVSGLRLAAGMDHVVEGPDDVVVGEAESSEDLGRVTITATLDRGRRLRIVKYLAYGWSSRRSRAALRDQVAAALESARHAGWDSLLAGQREYLDRYWELADVELEGDAELQQALRFGLFHTLQAGARSERRAIPAKGLTGPGYGGHAFWDTEMFVLPVLTYTAPDAARDALLWRHTTLDHARRRAGELGLEGAAFPWRTIAGEECSGYWPAGTAAFHINADIAHAVGRYQAATDDADFEREAGLELLVETARLWRSLGHHDAEGRFRIDGVTGPDEYSAIADNNIYTNLMAQLNLRLAADAVVRNPERARELGIDVEDVASWRAAADAVFIPYDERNAVHPQSEGFTEHQLWDFEHTDPAHYPLLLHSAYFDLYRKQVTKQADLVLALHLRGDAFSQDEKARDFAYYEALTVRDSSLSACTQAVIAAELGHLDLAYDYFGEAALIDLGDLHENTRDGLHIASLAGAWTVAVAGFGGLRDHEGALSIAPRLPQQISRISFTLRFRGRRLKVDCTPHRARYTLTGAALEITHHGKLVTLTPGKAITRKIPPAPAFEPPRQPRGREPRRRSAR